MVGHRLVACSEQCMGGNYSAIIGRQSFSIKYFFILLPFNVVLLNAVLFSAILSYKQTNHRRLRIIKKQLI